MNDDDRQWSKAAATESSKYHRVNRVNKPKTGPDVAKMSENQMKQASILDIDKWDFDYKAKYFHFCQNESVDGIEFDQKFMRKMIDKVRSARQNAIIVADMSSALGSRDLTKEGLWDEFGVVYGGSQKNFGTSGLCFTIIRDDVYRRVKEIHSNITMRSKLPIPIVMDWVKHSNTADYFPNTPSNLSIWMAQLVCEHKLSMGGIQYYEELADKKSKLLYDFLDGSMADMDKYAAESTDEKRRLCFHNEVDKELRSRMNVTFQLDVIGERFNKAYVEDLLKAAELKGLCGLKGHRSVGGLRASIYNGVEYESVETLVDFLEQYKKHQGQQWRQGAHAHY